MDLEKEFTQREDFKNILFALSQEKGLLQDNHTRLRIYQRLESLYHNSDSKLAFRHFYSDIFLILTTIQQNGEWGNIQILGQNLLEIRKEYRPMNKDGQGNLIDVSDSIRKLYDHVNLDIARMTCSDKLDRELLNEDHIKDIQAQIQFISKASTELNQKNKNIEVQLKDTQKQYITILGIFAGIVLSFTGGVAFSTSVLQNLHLGSPYRLVFVVLLIGLVLLNMIFGLFYYLERLVRNKKTSKLKPFIVTNIVIVLLLVMTTISWTFGLVERRNREIQQYQLMYWSSYSAFQKEMG